MKKLVRYSPYFCKTADDGDQSDFEAKKRKWFAWLLDWISYHITAHNLLNDFSLELPVTITIELVQERLDFKFVVEIEEELQP